MKAEEVGALREQTLGENRETLLAAAAALRLRLDAGGRLLACGNGGSATDAIDLVADLRTRRGGWPARPAIDLTEDSSILTAVANDVGVEQVFQRQVIAYGLEGDALVALSTSGNSANLIVGPGRGARRAASRRWRWSATTAGGSPPTASPTTRSSPGRSTSRGSRRRRRAPITPSVS